MMEAKLRETIELEVKTKPYSFKLTAQIYNFSWWYNGRTLIIPLENDVVAKVYESDREGALIAEIYVVNENTDIREVVEKISGILGLNENLSGFYEYASRDPLLSKASEILKGYHVRTTSLWNALLIGVCQQNASFRQGWRMLYEIYRRLGKPVKIPGYGETLFPPTPRTILDRGIEPLIEARTGYRAQTIYRIARFFVETRSLPEDPLELKQLILGIKGVGEYTARLSLVLSKRYYNEPPIDRWLKKIITVVYGVEEKEAEQYYKKYWGIWAGLASLLTTIALDAVTLQKALERIRKREPAPLINNKPTPLTLWRYY